MSLKSINAKLAGKVELVRGNGYQYYIFDHLEDMGPSAYGSRTVYTCWLSDYTDAEWVAGGLEFYNEMMETLKEIK